ncbi:ATP-binding protein [soil metagenome]
MLSRKQDLEAVVALLRASPVVALLGPRQVGKSTLARAVGREFHRVTTLDLEADADRRRVAEPIAALERLRGLVVIDEIQYAPELFRALRVLADRPRRPASFLVLGSASPELLRQTSETLAGRIAFHELGGFSLDEVGPPKLRRLWLRGGFPRAFTAKTTAESARWRRDFIRTFLERDLPQLDVRTPALALRRFWSMLAHVHGQTLNWSELGRSMGVADTTVRGYLDILEGTLVVQTLKPWHENISKRQVKSPKVYIRDSGLLHTLLDIETEEQLEGHPRVGASWEGFAIREVTRRLGARPEQCFFWSTHAGAELDLLVIAGERRLGFEIKRTAAPSITPSMRSALLDLKLDSLDVVHSGKETYPLSDRVRALALDRVLSDLTPLAPPKREPRNRRTKKVR